MKKNFGSKSWLYPMPVLIVGTYDENGMPNAMNAAWGGIYDTDQVMVCLAHEHKSTENIKSLKGLYTNIYNSSIHNSQKVDVSQMSIK